MEDTITYAQDLVIEAIQAGGSVVFRNEDSRDLSAEWLGNLLGGRIKNVLVHPRGISIENARIVGTVDWSHDRFCRFEFICCEFLENIQANNLQVDGEVSFTKSRFPSLNMIDATVEGDLHLEKLHLGESSSQINGAKKVLNLGYINVSGSIHLTETIIHGEVLLNGATVGQGIYLQNSEISSTGDAWALNADALTCGLNISLSSATVCGGVSFTDAHIRGNLDFNDAKISSISEDREAVKLHRVNVETSVFFRKSEVTGSINLAFSKINGLFCEGASMSSPHDWALNALGTECEQNVVFSDANITGGVSFTDAHIRGNLYLSAAKLTSNSEDREAVKLHRVNVGISVFFRKSEVTGSIDLAFSKIGSALSCEGITINSSNDSAINAWGIECKQNVVFADARITGGVSFTDAHIRGNLDFSDAKLSSNSEDRVAVHLHRVSVGTSVFFRKSVITGTVNLGSSKISGGLFCEDASISSSNDWAFIADAIKCGQDSSLSRATITGGATFMDAHFQSNLYFNATKISSNSGDRAAVTLHRVNVETSVFFRMSEISGSIDLGFSKIGNGLEFGGASINNPTGTVLKAFAAEIGGAANFISYDETQFRASGQIDLCNISARSLSFNGAQLTYDNDPALRAIAMRVKDSATFLNAEVTGGIDISTSSIGGALLCGGAVFKNPKGNALYAYQLQIGGNAEFGNGFKAYGRLNFLEVSASGLDLTKAEITFGSGAAFIGSRMQISGRLVLDEVKTTGRVTMIGASIGQLSIRGAEFGQAEPSTGAPPTDDLSDCETSTAAVDHIEVVFLLELATVRGNVKVTGDSHFYRGTVWQGTQIQGDLHIERAKFFGGKEAFFANQLKVGGRFTFKDIEWGEKARVSLRMANVMELDDLPNSYPNTVHDNSSNFGANPVIGSLDISGFVYSQFGDTSFNSRTDENGWNHLERLEWISRQTHQRKHDHLTEGQYSPQPYLQLAEVYRQMGKDHERRKVLKGQQQDLRKWGELSRASKWWSRIVDLLTGYGYESWRALVAIFLIYLLSVSLTTVVRDHGGFVATGNTASFVVAKHGAQSVQATSCTPYYPCNSSWLFPVDAAIPVINLHQSEFWSFNSSNSWGDYGELLFSLFSLLGWGFTSLLVAASAGLIKQN
jgi:hypothetical protein